jgi:hypothetical protein
MPTTIHKLAPDDMGLMYEVMTGSIPAYVGSRLGGWQGGRRNKSIVSASSRGFLFAHVWLWGLWE